jgi:ABC-2 type transport system ATP-binding protein
MTTTGQDVVCARGLTRRYGAVEALRDVSFRVEAGSVFGLLGRNGSGKTTTLRLLLGLLRPDAGSSTVFGEDSLRLSAACRQRIGYLSEEPFPYDDLPAPALLKFVAAFFPHWDWDYANRLAARFAVPPDRPLRSLSAGERRKTELLLVLAQKPDLLVLDDPAQGLDVTVRREFLWAALEVVRDEGRAVLFTSHILTDVERVVDTGAVLDGGRLRALDRLDDLKSQVKRLVFPPGGGEPAAVPGELARKQVGRELLLTTEAYSDELGARLRAQHPGLEVEDLNLEEVFVALQPHGTADAPVPEEVTS